MTNKIKYLVSFFLTITSIAIFCANKPIDPKKEKKLLELIASTLQKNHIEPKNLDDSFSKSVFEYYINSLDPNRFFFLKSDIEEFQKFEYKIDDLIKLQDLSFFYMTHDRLRMRLKESKSNFDFLTNSIIDFSIDETVNIEFDKQEYSKNSKQLEEKWKKCLKFYVLDTLVKKLKFKENNQTNSMFIKNFEKLETESRKNILKKLNSDENDFELLDRDFYFSKYLNAIIAEFDPHSKYYSQSEKDEFDMRISGKNIGIGLKFSTSNNYIEVKEIVFGSPAWKIKKIEVGDILLKISEGNEEEIDVIGFNLQDINKLIKGKIGTTIKLTLKKTDGTLQLISIKRDLFEYKESYVKSCIVERFNEKIGIIDLPKFYKDTQNDGQKDAAKDVAFQIENLKKLGVNGIILDLRDNGGGVVETAVQIAGLFIPNGPIVQIKFNGKKQETLSDNDNSVLWAGPLIVMINSNSASATEIFAAAIQDYNRGLIVGGMQSYGKGTVQNIIDLNQFNFKKDEENFGSLKLTTQKYYRINGGTTQINGVSSDIVMPDKYSYSDYGEKNEHNVLPWDKIKKVKYNKVNPDNFFSASIEAAKKRIALDINFKMIDEEAKLKNNQEKLKNVSLNFEKYKLIQNKIDFDFKKFDDLKKYKNFLFFKSTDEELAVLKKNVALDIKRKEWHKNLSTDIYIYESLNIMSDLLKKQFNTPLDNLNVTVKVEIKKTKIATKKSKNLTSH